MDKEEWRSYRKMSNLTAKVRWHPKYFELKATILFRGIDIIFHSQPPPPPIFKPTLLFNTMKKEELWARPCHQHRKFGQIPWWKPIIGVRTRNCTLNLFPTLALLFPVLPLYSIKFIPKWAFWYAKRSPGNTSGSARNNIPSRMVHGSKHSLLLLVEWPRVFILKILLLTMLTILYRLAILPYNWCKHIYLKIIYVRHKHIQLVPFPSAIKLAMLSGVLYFSTTLCITLIHFPLLVTNWMIRTCIDCKIIWVIVWFYS